MILVVAVWILYLNVIVRPINGGAPTAEAAPEPGLAQVFGAGVKVILGQIKETVGGTWRLLKERLSAVNEITINPLERNFMVEDLEPIPATALP